MRVSNQLSKVLRADQTLAHNAGFESLHLLKITVAFIGEGGGRSVPVGARVGGRHHLEHGAQQAARGRQRP